MGRRGWHFSLAAQQVAAALTVLRAAVVTLRETSHAVVEQAPLCRYGGRLGARS
jgi:hypothetical protein